MGKAVAMDVVIAGGHGQIALQLERLLADRGHRVRALIRNPDHAGDVEAAGAEPLICDLEELDHDGIADVIGDADAVVFAAGAGPSSGPQRKWTVDYAGAVKLMAACRRNGIGRYVIVSSMGADAQADDDGGFGTYLRAKGQADQKLRESGLQFTIVRPGQLADEPPSDRVHVATATGRGAVARADVAAVLAEVLERPETAGLTFEVVGGDVPVADAVRALTSA